MNSSFIVSTVVGTRLEASDSKLAPAALAGAPKVDSVYVPWNFVGSQHAHLYGNMTLVYLAQ